MEFNSFSLHDTVPKLKENKICLLDADYVKYVVTSRLYKDFQKREMTGENNVYLKEEPVITYTKEWVENIFMKIDDPILFCFSGKSYNTFRNSVSFVKQYKGNRTKDYTDYPGKSEDMFKIVKYIQDNYVSLIFNDLEADDILSVLQDENTYIASNDKDLKQVPGYHYDFDKNSVYKITNEIAIHNLAMQLLKGDTVDNISGLEGIGETKATLLLKDVYCKNYFFIVLQEFQKKFGIFKGTDTFCEMWMLVKMRENRGDYFKEKYKGMFDVKDMLMLEIKKRKLLESEVK